MSETIHDALVLVDVDGTTSNTAQHMQGLNNRLIEAFPAIGEAMPQILAGRRDFREAYGHLSFAQQDEIWQQEHRGTTSHSQLDIYIRLLRQKSLIGLPPQMLGIG